MEQLNIGEIPKTTKLDSYSKEDLMTKYSLLEGEYLAALKEIYRLKNQKISDEQLILLSEQLSSANKALYGKTTERYKKPENSKNKDSEKTPAPKTKKPSERYPNIPIKEVIIEMNPVPNCEACGEIMKVSSMTEDSEQLTVIPKKYEIILQKKVKYKCSCHSCITTAPTPARIVPGSSYSNEMIIDIVLSKYCDLIPIERYVAMAGRGGLVNLPAHSLIELTHEYADFLKPVYRIIKGNILKSRVIHADETPHNMLEGSDKKSWYLWGFSTKEDCYLECHDTRSGDVASEILLKSKCEILMSDVYSGYNKAIKVVNKQRIKEEKNIIKSVHCNAHARRYFFKSWPEYKEAQFYLDHYHEIYQLEAQTKGKADSDILKIRSQMLSRFKAMKEMALEELSQYPNANKYAVALQYFLKNFESFILFIKDAEVPIDNNSQERLLRNHVVGRKTWYGTHSKRGAETASILFSVVETCKLNHVNPRDYFSEITKLLLNNQKIITPAEFKRQNLL